MKTGLLKITLSLALFIVFSNNAEAQTYDFPTDDQGFTAPSQMGIIWDNDDTTNGWGAGDGGLIASRSGVNATIKPPTVIDATASNYLRLRVKNTSAASTFRFLVAEATGSSWLTFNISSGDTEFQTYDFQLNQDAPNWTLSSNNTPVSPDYWNAANENVSMLFRGAYTAGEGNIFIDRIRFYSVGDTFYNFIINPTFDDSPLSVTGWGLPSSTARPFAEFSLDDTETEDGNQGLKIKYIADSPATDNNLFIENINTETFTTAFDDTAILKASMKVKIKRLGAGAGTDVPVKFQGNFRINGAFNRVSNKETSGALDTWETLEFEVGMAAGQTINDISFRTNLQHNGYLQYDEIFIDEVKACINCATLGTEHIVKDDSTVKLFPNPVNNILNVFATGRNISKIEVYSILGNKVLQVENSDSIDVSALSKGVYISKIFGDDNAVSTKRFVKQ